MNDLGSETGERRFDPTSLACLTDEGVVLCNELSDLCRELEYTDDARQALQIQIGEKICEVLRSVRDSLISQKTEIDTSAETIVEQASGLLQRFGMSLPAVESSGSITAKARRRQAEHHLSTAQSLVSDLQSRVDAAKSRYSKFEPSPEIDSFIAAQVSWSSSSIDEFSRMVSEYEATVLACEEEKARILAILRELEDVEADLSGPITLGELRSMREACEQMKATRVEEIRELGKAIAKLWDGLGISEAERQSFLTASTGLSKSGIALCRAEHKRLKDLWTAKLTGFYEEIVAEIVPIIHQCQNLQFDRHEVIDETAIDEAKKALAVARAELVALENLQVSIAEREELLATIARNKGEKDAKRTQVRLQKVEKELVALLHEYRERAQADYRDPEGRPYIESLGHVKMSTLELKMQLERLAKGRKKARKSGPPPACPTVV